MRSKYNNAAVQAVASRAEVCQETAANPGINHTTLVGITIVSKTKQQSVVSRAILRSQRKTKIAFVVVEQRRAQQ